MLRANRRGKPPNYGAGTVSNVGRQIMYDELEILRAEYHRAQESPLFDDPKFYCVLLDLIQARIDDIENLHANF